MARSSYRVLVVEPDPDIMEMLVAALVGRFNAQVTCVATAEDCLDIEMVDPHDLVVAELSLEDGNGIALTRKLGELSQRPVILLADAPTRVELLRALRAGVCDVFPKPFRMIHFLDAAERVLDAYRAARREQQRYRELRRLVRQLVQDRRLLNKRTELVCRDLVGAHRRLVHRVLEIETNTASES